MSCSGCSKGTARLRTLCEIKDTCTHEAVRNPWAKGFPHDFQKRPLWTCLGHFLQKQACARGFLRFAQQYLTRASFFGQCLQITRLAPFLVYMPAAQPKWALIWLLPHVESPEAKFFTRGFFVPQSLSGKNKLLGAQCSAQSTGFIIVPKSPDRLRLRLLDQ